MFGYATIHQPQLTQKNYKRYRSYYCGLCKILKDDYGRVGQLTLTFDMTFLVLLLSGLYEPKEILRNILYAGIWTKYGIIQSKKKKSGDR